MKDATVTDKKTCRTLAGKDVGVALHVHQARSSVLLRALVVVFIIEALVCLGWFSVLTKVCTVVPRQ